ncbi:MAG TPA: LCP family protein [Candidatus Limnocylindrales bacterium]|jgi:LCP family protein required for cell wall assembly|nr:LCP family protein [Candidatus Limnocylindrales bacterium]
MSGPSPALAALLSFLFPGLGQVYAGAVRRGLLWAIPMVLFIVGVLWVLAGGAMGLLGLVANAQTRNPLLVLNLAFFFYHLAAMFDAYQVARQERMIVGGLPSRGAPVALAALVAVTVLFHGVPQAVGIWGGAILDEVAPGRTGVIPSYSPIVDPTATPGGSPTPSVTPSPTAPPTGTPRSSPTPTTPGGSPLPTPIACTPGNYGSWPMAQDGRVNILLVGSDSRSESGVGSASLRTDSMMLLSVDIATCKSALFSFPRNMQQPSAGSRYPSWFRIQLENGDNYGGFLFGLWRDAASSPGRYPGSAGVGPECQQMFDCERGWRALTGAIQNMAGVQVDAIVAVNLKGFVDVVNNLPQGGIWLDVPQRLRDDDYFNSRQERMKIDFRPGCQFMDGEEALAYARSRHQDSDYQRGRRQQLVLQQVRRQMDPLALLPHVPALLNVAQQNIFMTIDDTDIANLAQVAASVDADRMYRYDFAPNRLARLGNSMAAMRAKVRDIFNEPEPTPAPRPTNRPATCPAPGQTPNP